MFSKVFSGALQGIEGVIITVEADVSDGIPMFDLVGFLGSEVREARERVRVSLKNSGYLLQPKRITVNLAPADIRKEGTAFDFPIAMAVLTAFGYLSQDCLKDTLFIGEVSLDGNIKKVNGVLPIVFSACKHGFKRCLVPMDNVKEGAAVQGIQVFGMSHIKDAVKFLNNDQFYDPYFLDKERMFGHDINGNIVDFSEVLGQNLAKRAIEIAVSGMHNVLMIGPPGSGKTMIAKRIPTIMPCLEFEECLEISKIYSVSGLLDATQSLINTRPFRSPHHTITSTALAGGGRTPIPGEISLAHLGVLFLDEFPEFNRNTIEILRQPLEENQVTIARVHGTYHFPSDFMLVAAMNPCNCGHFPDRTKCHCSMNQVKRYLGKISRPLLDRIDLSVEVTQVPYKELGNKTVAESSFAIRERVQQAREIQKNRYKEDHIFYNSQLTPKLFEKYCVLGSKEQEMLEEAFYALNLSARAYHRILKVARTIADLDHANFITMKHLSEAIFYRSMDQKYWGDSLC